MKAALVRGQGQTPVYADFEAPLAGPGELLVTVRAAALSPLARARASGTHYSSAGTFPFVAGVDGVGTLDDGRRVYFLLPRAPFGAMATQSVVAAANCVPVPEGLDDVTASAIANPGMSSWAALTYRANMTAGDVVLINGATGSSGQLAVRIARHLGASRVIATGRNAAVLESLGADVTIPLGPDAQSLKRLLAAQFAQGVDVVLDYLWGTSAEIILGAGAGSAPEGRPIRFVQIGNASGATITLPGPVLRSSSIELKGSGLGSVPLPDLCRSIAGVFEAAGVADLVLPVRQVPLSEVEASWSAADAERIVFTDRD